MNILELSDVLNDISDFVNGCLGPLGANGLSNIATYAVDLGVQLCSTLIIFLLVRFLLWKPITKMLEQKRAEADKELEEAHAANENAKAIEAELKKQMAEDQTKRLRVATIFSYGANEEESDGILDEENSEDTSALDQPSRDFLEEAIKDYNKMFHTNYDTSSSKITIKMCRFA